MKTVSYKGYQGKVEFEDGVLVIRVLHVDDVLIAECDSASEVQIEFESLIDAYLEDCLELGREPSKPFKGTFNVRVSQEVHKRAAFAAAAEGQSLNTWVSMAMEEKLECDKFSQRVQAVFDTKREEIEAIHSIAHHLSGVARAEVRYTRLPDLDVLRRVSGAGSPWAFKN